MKPNDLYDELNLKYNLALPKVKVLWSDTLRTTAGRISINKMYPSYSLIELSREVFERNKEEFWKTLLHEMIHLWVWINHKTLGHDRYFAEKQTECLGEYNRCHSYDVIKEETKWQVVCPVHGKIAERSREKHNMLCRCGREVVYLPIGMKISESVKTRLFFDGPAIQMNNRLLPLQDIGPSEIIPNWFQAPASLHNLFKLLNQNIPYEDKEQASLIIYDKINEHKHIIDALRFKTLTENGIVNEASELEKYCGIVNNPVEYLREYCKFYKPFSQQLIGADLILKMKRVGILYDMRVGKTLTALIALKYCLKNNLCRHAIIVCPAPIMQSVWQYECTKQNLSSYVCNSGELKDKFTIQLGDVDVYIISYESLVQRLEIFQSYHELEDFFVIADETAFIKNPTAKRTKALQNLTFWPHYVVMLTGAPMEQGPGDIWSQFYCIDRGETFGTRYSDFEFKYLAVDGRVRRNRKLDFEIAIQRKSLRYVRSEADQFAGKDKNFRYISIAPTAEQAKAANDVIDGLVFKDDEEIGEIKQHVLVVYGYLREICCGYNKYDTGDGYSRFRFQFDAKALWIENFLHSNPGVPAVIWCEFDEHEAIICDMLRREGISHIWLKRDKQRYGYDEAIRMFQEGDVRVLVAKSTQGYGFTLNRIPAVEAGKGSFPVMIYASPTWRLGAFLQSQDRCIGVYEGKNICTPIYALVTAGSIEEKIISILRSKKDVSEELLKDRDREGFISFLNELRLEVKSGDIHFDAMEMQARKLLHISPEKKLTHKMIDRMNKKYCVDKSYIKYLKTKYKEDGELVHSYVEDIARDKVTEFDDGY